ncbi:MAG: SprT-like domain-containing protein [Deltaproteobacteria bacterium]|nr:SprT-like domain-containing protein [Deltaproteobacteria bacterium]
MGHRRQQHDPPTEAEQLGIELETALQRELLRCWHQLNETFFKGALRPPVLRLVDTRSLLGRWTLEHRTLDISRPLAVASPWGSVVEVLKHELAHQYVHEVLQAIDEPAHGPAFRQVCERLGIDAAATGMPTGSAASDSEPRILKRVAGLLALAESPNRHEAENAAAAARRLLLKHNIELSAHGTRSRYHFRQLGMPKGRVQEHEHILAAILADHFFVEAIWVPGYRPHDGKRGSLIEVCGTPENLEIASYAHSFLTGTAERLWKQHKREAGIRGNRDRRGFLAGVMEGFRERLNEEKRQSEERGMVWVGDGDLNRYHRARHPYVRSVRLQGRRLNAARYEGREAGRNIVLHRGVAAGGGGRGGRALPAKKD